MGNEFIVLAVLTIGAIIAVGLWIRTSVLKALSRPKDDQGLTFLQTQMNAATQQSAQQIDNLRDSVQKLTSQMQQSLAESNKTVGERLDKAASVITGVSKQLGKLEESSRHIFDLGKSIQGLEEVLRSPKLRGGMGELFLDDLLSQIMPSDHYETQYTFKGGEKVDAVIHLKPAMVPVDAKFPLENFRKASQAESEDLRKVARREFIRDVKKHVDAIAKKYIRTDEGTFDFALMYIPAENIYYETIIRDEDAGGEMTLFNYALERRVIPVSPNSFYAYLQTILLGLKGMRVEESAREIINSISRLRKEFERFGDAFRLVGTHLDNSSKQYGEAQKRLAKIENKMEQIEGVAGVATPPETLLPEGD